MGNVKIVTIRIVLELVEDWRSITCKPLEHFFPQNTGKFILVMSRKFMKKIFLE